LARYRPQDWDQAACRKRLGDAKELGHAQKLQALKEIYENVKPVRTSGPVDTGGNYGKLMELGKP